MMKAIKKNYGVIFILLIISIFLWSKIFIAIRRELHPMNLSTDGVKKNLQLPEPNNWRESYQQNWMDSLQKINDPFNFHFSADKQSGSFNRPSQENLDDTSKLSFVKYYGFMATDSGRVAVLEEPTDHISFLHQGSLFGKYKIIEITGEGIILKKGKNKIFIAKAQN